MSELPRSLTDILGDISHADDKDSAFIVSATINLYMENLRRCHNRVLLVPSDVVNLFKILDMLLLPPVPGPNDYSSNGRNRMLTPEEEAEMTNVVEKATIPRRPV